MDNTAVTSDFVESVISGRAKVRSNSELSLDLVGGALQFLDRSEGLVATADLNENQKSVVVRCRSSHWPAIHTALLAAHFLPVQKAPIPGFYYYEPVDIPPGYRVNFTDSLDLMQVWCSYETPSKPHLLTDLLVFNRGSWYPIRDLTCEQGTLKIRALGAQLELYPLDRLVWLQRQHGSEIPASNSPSTATAARFEASDMQRQNSLAQFPDVKQLGDYLVDAGLLSPAQVSVALSDQEATGMRMGEILVTRGWVKQKTIEFLMEHVILPQRSAARQELELTRRKMEQRVEQRLALQPQPQQSLKQDLMGVSQSQQFLEQEFSSVSQLQQLLEREPDPALQPQQSQQSEQSVLPQSQQPLAPSVPSVHERETLVTYEPTTLDLDELTEAQT